MRLSNGFVIDKEKTFGELKFTAVRDVFLQNEDGTPSTQLKKRIYDLKCSLHGGIIPVCTARSTVKGISVQCSWDTIRLFEVLHQRNETVHI